MKVRYTGSIALIRGMVGEVLSQDHVDLAPSERALVLFSEERLPLSGRKWNLRVSDLELA